MRKRFHGTIAVLLLTGKVIINVAALAALNMPPLDLSKRKHTSDFSARKNHPSTYEESPKFLGPLTLSATEFTSDNRTRIKHYLGESVPSEKPKALAPTSSTNKILSTIIDQFTYNDAPIDVKEMAESIEFYLRTRKRLLGSAKKRHAKNIRIAKQTDQKIEDGDEIAQVEVFDFCCGHGLTAMLFTACNPPRKDRIVTTHLVDIKQPPSHQVLRDLITEVCPWVDDLVTFHESDIDSFIPPTSGKIPITIATHACGSLTDKILEAAVKNSSSFMALMPCCYTGTDNGMPYGIKRAMGVAWTADIKRVLELESHGYHTDFSTIPKEITPLNRIIIAEDRS